MYSLYNTKSAIAGYRLHSVEVFNWGTFDKEIFKISPEGNTTLLTGVNGSGKTTFVEALLTLLVPEGRKRSYNSASGQKSDRSEESYVLGEYGDAEAEGGRITQKLREDKSKAYSILIAVFKNEDKFVSLLQARWFSGTDMKRNYIIAHAKLSIENDITPFDASGAWKRQLKKNFPKIGNREIILDLEGPTKYAEALRKVFGMREKALTLFSQMIGLKVVGNLDEFIRNNMLEEGKIEADFQNLRSNYQKLLDAHREMQKAEMQLELLKPVKEKVAEIADIKLILNQYQSLKETSPIFFSYKKKRMLEGTLEATEDELQRLLAKISELSQQIFAEREHEKELDAAIRNDETGAQIREMDKELNGKEREKGKREVKLKKYNALAAKLNLTENPFEIQFGIQFHEAKERKNAIDEELNDKENGIRVKWSDLRQAYKELGAQVAEKQAELDSLLKQKNNITGRVSEIRNEILAFTDAAESEIPFVGELIRVLDKEKTWELAIEKVLHSFALRLIVPEKYYKSVNEYVNDHNLKGRIVYERVKMDNSFHFSGGNEAENMYSKIEIKRNSEYHAWVEHQLKSKYNYICTDKNNLAHFTKALTAQGLIKNDSRHEKDDRPNISQRENYVLGWDNKEKVKMTKEALRLLENEMSAKNQEITKLEKRQSRLEKEKEDINNFLTYENYAEIDVKALEFEIKDLQDQKRELEKSNNKTKVLEKQLLAIQKKIKDLEENCKKEEKLQWEKESEIARDKAELKACQDFLAVYQDIDFKEQFAIFEKTFAKDFQILSASMQQKQENINQKIAEKISKELDNQRNAESKLRVLMLKYKRPDDEIMQQFPDWTSETHRLSEDIKYVEDDYISIYHKIQREELVQHKNNFKKYLNEDMITQMTNFSTLLETQEENIRESIEALNDSLRKIKFRNNPHTFIRLYATTHRYKNLDDFKFMLKDWKPNQAEYERGQDDSILENSFLKIKELIDRLTQNEAWRKEVTDVRNWLKFTAKEHFDEDEKRVLRVYENTGKLSSGEQAQITYTIMGAAIAYQYGILKDGLNTNSFRFICVDEAFAKQDEDKAIYLMDLIQKLNLQMLLVTPDDKIQIAEPYISAVHVVHRVNNRNSRIFDTTIQEAKAAFEGNKNE